MVAVTKELPQAAGKGRAGLREERLNSKAGELIGVE